MSRCEGTLVILECKSMWTLTETPCCLDGNTIILLPELMFFLIRANLNDEKGADSVRRGGVGVASSLFMSLVVFTWCNMVGLTSCARPLTNIFPNLEDLV